MQQAAGSSVFVPHLLIILFFTGSSLFGPGPAMAQSSRPRYYVIPENPRPGEPITVAVGAEGGPRAAALLSNSGRRLAGALFFTVQAKDGGRPFMAAVLAAPAAAPPGFAVINIEGDRGTILEIPLVIRERDFSSEEIALDETLTGLRTAPDPQKTAEAEQLWAILRRTGGDVYCCGSFSPPVSSTRRTGFFGDRRVFKYSNGKSDASIHAGIDYGVPSGTEVKACAGGKVVLARFRIVTGNSVVIEHLPGVYSLYYHLNKIEVSEGSMVDTGTLLGRSGATGLATGPHLHWEIRVSGENADPDAFIARPILDKDAILAKIGDIP
ncbi:MAG: M23 family metallopeptidase [Treponema sp.]|nr:M23 family metallopeptidase [Treponema sp.]